MESIIQEALSAFGLDQKEIRVYVGLLELGETTAGELAQKVHLQRELTYVVLNRLENKGVISTIIKNNKKRFEAINPSELLKKIEEKKKILEQALPTFKQLQDTPSSFKPKIQTFEGKEGIKTIFNKILDFYETSKSKAPILGYGSAGKFED
ncbi:MAG: helix-turn-helix domain-containing protein, partial [Candidatus Woesearchaeota archaeon]|nr:helix-turn-helix domain-containing protein [Candidatus Woesearchaeota archaeon]